MESFSAFRPANSIILLRNEMNRDLPLAGGRG